MAGIRANKCGHGEREINKNLSKRDEFIMENLPGPEKPVGPGMFTQQPHSLSLSLSFRCRARVVIIMIMQERGGTEKELTKCPSAF